MRVFVAGASGAIGSRLVPQLIEKGHEVIGTHRSPGHGDCVRALGAEPLELDLLDRDAVMGAVLAQRPDAIVHQATALSDLSDFKHFDRSFHQTNLLRTQGTDALLAAAEAAGVSRFVAQSYASALYERTGGMVKTEDDPLDPSPVPAMRETVAAMRYLDEAVTDAGGIVLRYGVFYGASNDGLIEPVRKRMFPIVGDGGGVSSFIHSTTPLRQPCSRSRSNALRATTSSTMTLRRYGFSRRSPTPSEPSRRAASPAGWRACSRATPRS